MATAAALTGPPGLGLRTFRALARDELAFFVDIPRRYGDLARFRLGPYVWYVVNDPTLVEDVLVHDAAGYTKGLALQRARLLLGDGLITSEDPLHARQRRLAAPAFSPRRIAGYGATMTAAATAAGDRWDDGATVDVARDMTRLTLEIVMTALFGADVDAATSDRVGRSLTDVLEAFDLLVTNPLGPVVQHVPTRRVRRFRAARAELDAFIARVAAARRHDAATRDDLLSAYLTARDGAPGDDGGMSDALLRDELMTLILAGHETTTNWLTWTWLALAENRAVEARVHEELARELGDGPVTVEDLPRLRYSAAMLEEALRLYPPVWGIGRRARDDRVLGGHHVPAGSIVTLCQYTVQRDPRWWPDAERFEPERWLGSRDPSRPRGAFFPFADGPRSCLGARFARTEALLALATLARRFRLRRATSGPVAFDAKITLRPRGGLPMRVEARG